MKGLVTINLDNIKPGMEFNVEKEDTCRILEVTPTGVVARYYYEANDSSDKVFFKFSELENDMKTQQWELKLDNLQIEIK